MIKKYVCWLPLCFVILLAVTGSAFLLSQKDLMRTDGFSLDAVTRSVEIENTFASHLQHEVNANINQALKQSYKYLGRGRQAFVFSSEDGQYVIKFFKHPTPITRFWKSELRPILRYLIGMTKNIHKKDPYEDSISSILLAFNEFRNETGLMHIHFPNQSTIHQTLSVFDKSGKRIEIPLEKTTFAIQHKAQLIFPLLNQLKDGHQVDQIKDRLAQVFELVLGRIKKGLIRPDPMLIRRNNLGFLEDRAIYIDIGSFSKPGVRMACERSPKDLKHLLPIRDWLQTHCPNLITDYDELQKHAELEISQLLKSS